MWHKSPVSGIILFESMRCSEKIREHIKLHHIYKRHCSLNLYYIILIEWNETKPKAIFFFFVFVSIERSMNRCYFDANSTLRGSSEIYLFIFFANIDWFLWAFRLESPHKLLFYFSFSYEIVSFRFTNK